MKPTVSIIIPTFNNPEFFNPCVLSIISSGALNGLCKLIIVNNGKQPIKEKFGHVKNIIVLDSGRNLGWEGGLALGLGHANTEFVCFQNDDTLIPKATQTFYQNLLWPFRHKEVAAVGPSTTNASGYHSIFMPSPLRMLTEVSYLIFFTVMIRRSDLDAVGGIDTTAPGGDDFDLSIRFRKAGKKLLINPDAFIIHHAFKTGDRVRGGSNVSGGWNSKEMQEKTNQWLIRKHGFKSYMETIRGLDYSQNPPRPEDTEGDVVSQFVQGETVVELGCGFRKTVNNAIGVDRVAKDSDCQHIGLRPSVADVEADVTKELPFKPFYADTVIARHILEHCVDTIATLSHWNRILKMNGRLIIAVPNQDQCDSIPMNPEHVHAFTPDSLARLMQFVGFKIIGLGDPRNGHSFVACFEKVLHVEQSSNGKIMETVNA